MAFAYPAHLLSIPLEIRLRVYDYLFTDAICIVKLRSGGVWLRELWCPRNEITQVCQKLRHETFDIYKLSYLRLLDLTSKRRSRPIAFKWPSPLILSRGVSRLTVDAYLLKTHDLNLCRMPNLKTFVLLNRSHDMENVGFTSYLLGPSPWTKLEDNYEFSNQQHRRKDQLNILKGEMDEGHFGCHLVRSLLQSTRNMPFFG